MSIADDNIEAMRDIYEECEPLDAINDPEDEFFYNSDLDDLDIDYNEDDYLNEGVMMTSKIQLKINTRYKDRSGNIVLITDGNERGFIGIRGNIPFQFREDGYYYTNLDTDGKYDLVEEIKPLYSI